MSGVSNIGTVNNQDLTIDNSFGGADFLATVTGSACSGVSHFGQDYSSGGSLSGRDASSYTISKRLTTVIAKNTEQVLLDFTWDSTLIFCLTSHVISHLGSVGFHVAFNFFTFFMLIR